MNKSKMLNRLKYKDIGQILKGSIGEANRIQYQFDFLKESETNYCAGCGTNVSFTSPVDEIHESKLKGFDITVST